MGDYGPWFDRQEAQQAEKDLQELMRCEREARRAAFAEYLIGIAAMAIVGGGFILLLWLTLEAIT